MTNAVVLNYPHARPSLEPLHLRRHEVWQIAETARRQICGSVYRPRIDVTEVVERTARMRVNGLDFATHWDLGRALSDQTGQPVLGLVEHDAGCPDAAMIYMNGELIGDREDWARSTAVHELGHAVFDAPAWIAGHGTRRAMAEGQRRSAAMSQDTDSGEEIDWREWRANEFMGAFLAPRDLVRRHVMRLAASMRIPMREGARGRVIDAAKGGYEVVEALAVELAELFGVSIGFVEVRLRKYGLVTG